MCLTPTHIVQRSHILIKLIAYWVFFHAFFVVYMIFFFSKLTLWKILSGIPSECQTVWTLIIVGPDLGPNCLPRLSADDKELKVFGKISEPWNLGHSDLHLSRVVRKPTFWFPTWSDTNQAVQLQKTAKGLKFRFWKVEGLDSLCSENKG